MKNNQDLYSTIQNPLDNPNTIKKLIKAYSKSSIGFGGLYSKLIMTVDKQYHSGEYYPVDKDYFYAMMFNKWKNSIVNMSKESFVQLFQQGSFDNDLVTLRNYLKKVVDVTTSQEANNIFYGEYNNQTLENAIEKYRWTSFGEGSGWVHVASRYVTAKSDKIPKVEHRLYLNTESIDTYKMISKFVEKCDEYDLPYYFKFDQMGYRDDTIVIYSDTENLLKYIQVLENIKQQNPDLVANVKEPPLLTGKINNWIGYGSEPLKNADGHYQSFNSVRSEVLKKVIDTETKNWILSHRCMKINYKGKTMTFQEYITIRATNNFLDKLEKKGNQFTSTSDDVAKRYGYLLSDLKNPQFKNNMCGIVNGQIGNMLTKLCNGTKLSEINGIEMDAREGNTITFTSYVLNETIEQLAVVISERDKSFSENIRANIIKEAQNIGIDPNKFCFDINTRDRMFDYDKTENEKIGFDYEGR